MNQELDIKESNLIEKDGRRKAIKTIVGGAAALTAYHVLPVKWGTPIIEQVFLPAHAATSGVETTNGDETTSSIGTHTIWIEVVSVSAYSGGGQETVLNIIWEASPVWDDIDSFTFSISSGGMTSTHSSFTGKVGEDGGLTLDISPVYGVTDKFPTSGTYVLNVTYSGHQYTPTGPMTVTVPTI